MKPYLQIFNLNLRIVIKQYCGYKIEIVVYKIFLEHVHYLKESILILTLST